MRASHRSCSPTPPPTTFPNLLNRNEGCGHADGEGVVGLIECIKLRPGQGATGAADHCVDKQTSAGPDPIKGKS